MTSDQFWGGGARVEVERVVRSARVYYPAKVINKPTVRKNKVWVEYEYLTVRDSMLMKEYVNTSDVRPAPPREVKRWFEAGDDVDVYRITEGCWVKGKVTDILEDSTYVVKFEGRVRIDTEVDHFNLRLHRDWNNGVWIPSLLQSSQALQSGNFVDMMVEVRNNEKGFEGAWFSAKIISFLGANRYIVEYQTLKTEDGSEWLKEEARGWNIRPVPPQLNPTDNRYKMNDGVDAWYNDGWWSGRICRVNNENTRYDVFFETTYEIMEFTYNDLRYSQMWKNEEWSRT